MPLCYGSINILHHVFTKPSQCAAGEFLHPSIPFSLSLSFTVVTLVVSSYLPCCLVMVCASFHLFLISLLFARMNFSIFSGEFSLKLYAEQCRIVFTHPHTPVYCIGALTLFCTPKYTFIHKQQSIQGTFPHDHRSQQTLEIQRNPEQKKCNERYLP